MTVEEYSNKVSELIKAGNGSFPGVKLGKSEKVRMNIMPLNGNPTLIICDTDENNNPVSIRYCMEMSDVASANVLQIWNSEALNILAHNGLQKTNTEDLYKVWYY